MKSFFRLALLILTVNLITASASATTYYIAANGSDSNNGTSKTTPWLHAPGMPNCTSNCAATTPGPGDQIIFRGGDTWHFGNSSASPYAGGTWNFTRSGSSGNLIYLGVDQTWYSGSAWARPVLTGDNPVFNGSTWPSSCAYDFGAPKSLVSLGSYNQFDNFEITGVCWSGNVGGGNPGIVNTGSNDLITNDWWHGYTMTSSSTDTMGMTSNSSNVTFDHDIFDGSDSPHWPAGNSNCAWNGASACTTGVALYPRCAVVKNTVFHYIRVAGVCIDHQIDHDNTYEYAGTSPTGTMEGAQHDDALMYYHGSSSASGVSEQFYNNTVRHNWIAEQFYIPVSGGSTAYFFNNVFYDNHNATPSNCIQFNAQSSGTQTLYIYNNTFDNDTDNSSGWSDGCVISVWGTSGGNSMGVPWSGPIYAANNHLIGYSNLSTLFTTRSSGASYNLIDGGGNVIEATSTARSQGYLQSTMPVGDGPTSSGGSTVAAGQNKASSCATFSSDNELCSATSGSASESSGILTFPAITIIPRPSTGAWDAGAFQFGSGSQTPAPPTGLAASVQ